MKSAGVRVELDDSSETFNKKIRAAVTQKIPNIAIVGGKEAESRTVTLRRYGVEQQESIALGDLVGRVLTIS